VMASRYSIQNAAEQLREPERRIRSNLESKRIATTGLR
jgi:hypothetical protein